VILLNDRHKNHDGIPFGTTGDLLFARAAHGLWLHENLERVEHSDIARQQRADAHQFFGKMLAAQLV
jgi:hypothetical protein